MTPHIRIGTRGSRLAQTQTDIFISALRKVHPEISIEVVTIQTSGDWKPSDGEVRLPENKGGKGQFAKEIEESLLAGRIDCGVHSLKDMPAFLPDGLAIEHVLPAEDPRDVFISPKYKTWRELPEGAIIGTSSLRRQAFLLAQRPGVNVVTLRGNVQTRLDKMKAGQVDGTFLALAGLRRLGLEAEATQILEPEDFLPACGQGVIAIEIRTENERIRSLIAAVHDRATGMRVAAERKVLQILDGSCHTPIGVYALHKAGKMTLSAMVAEADGSQFCEDRIEGLVQTEAQAAELGDILGRRLKAKVPSALLEK
jgi:hydroxymethylbilane synthase